MADKKIRLIVSAEVKKAINNLNRVEKKTSLIGKASQKTRKAFLTLGKTIVAAYAIKVVVRFMKESAKLAAQTKTLEKNFMALGKGVGFSHGTLGKFREATNGTVSDIELMKQANNAMLLGIVESDDQFASLIDNAQRLAKAVGKDAAFGIESLTTGIGRQSKLMLDNLGIMVDTQGAYEKYAEAIGVNTSELDENQRKQAFIQATMESIESKVKTLGDETLDANDSLLQANVAWEDLKKTLGEDILPIIPILIEKFMGAYEITKDFLGLFGDNRGLKNIIEDLDEAGINADEYRKTLLEVEIAELEAALSKDGLTASAEDLGKVKDGLVESTGKLGEALTAEAEAEKKFAEAGHDSEEVKRQLLIVDGALLASDVKILGSGQKVIEMVKFATDSDQKLNDKKQELLDTGIEEVRTAEAHVKSTEAEISKNKEHLGTIATVIQKKKELADTNARIAESEKPTTEDGEVSPAIEMFALTEQMKDDILKAHSEQRALIMKEEQIGEVPREFYKQSIDLLNITLESKDKLMKEYDDKKRKREQKAHKAKIQENLESAILSGQSAKEAAISVIKAEVAEAQAGLISSIMKAIPFPVNLVVAAGAGAMIGKVTDKIFGSFATGGSFVSGGIRGGLDLFNLTGQGSAGITNNRIGAGEFFTRGRTILPTNPPAIVGDNASGMERIDVTPLPSPTGRGGSIVININAPVVDEYVVDSIIPAIERARKLNL